MLNQTQRILWVVYALLLAAALIFGAFILLRSAFTVTSNVLDVPSGKIGVIETCAEKSYSAPMTAYIKQDFGEAGFIECLESNGYEVVLKTGETK